MTIGPIGLRARELHARHHADRRGVSCADCRTAASWLIRGRERGVPRARRATEPAQRVSAAELPGGEDYGRIVQTLGHRGYLRYAAVQPDGRVYVCTASGVATYPVETTFFVWGP